MFSVQDCGRRPREIRPGCACGDGQRAKWAKYYFPVPCPFCKSVCREAGSKQNQFSDLGRLITAPLKKNSVTGGQKQCTETNVSEGNSSESIVYIEYSWCYEEHTKLYYTYFKLFIVSWYFFNFFKLLEWILNGLAAEAIQCLFFLQYTAIYSNLSSYFLKSDLFLKQNRKC